jgi:hypothetical protein
LTDIYNGGIFDLIKSVRGCEKLPEIARGKYYTLTLRLDDEMGKLFAALVSLNGTTATEVLRDCVKKYIENNKEAAAKKLRVSIITMLS